MSEQVKSSVAGQAARAVSGWFKAIVMGVMGLAGGAAVMYFTPFVERIVKPARPLANFAYEVQGNQVTFEDRSTGSEGFWDFGDESALEQYNPDQKKVTHTFKKPGSYAVKLVVRSFA